LAGSVLDDVGVINDTTGPLVVMPETAGTCTIAVLGKLRLHARVGNTGSLIRHSELFA
jgi:hypothetical protein